MSGLSEISEIPLEPRGLLICLNMTIAILMANKMQVTPNIAFVRSDVLEGMFSLVLILVRTPMLAQITTEKISNH